MDFQYRIFHVNIKERWIMISSDDDFEREEPNAFINFIKKIRTDVDGTIENVGDMQYKIKGDGYGFIYQWDELFGISIIYPEGVAELQARDFLSRYMSEF